MAKSVASSRIGDLYKNGMAIAVVVVAAFAFSFVVFMTTSVDLKSLSKEYSLSKKIYTENKSKFFKGSVERELLSSAISGYKMARKTVLSKKTSIAEKAISLRSSKLKFYIFKLYMNSPGIVMGAALGGFIYLVIILVMYLLSVPRGRHLVQSSSSKEMKQRVALYLNQTDEFDIFNVRKVSPSKRLSSFALDTHDMDLIREISGIYMAYSSHPAALDGKHGEGCLLVDHVHDVAEKAYQLATGTTNMVAGESSGFVLASVAAALAHDLGKIVAYVNVGTDKKPNWKYFQRSHATFSGLILRQCCPSFSRLSAKDKMAITRAVIHHHTFEGDLPKGLTMYERSLIRIVKAADGISSAIEKGQVREVYSEAFVKEQLSSIIQNGLREININGKSPKRPTVGLYFPEKNLIAVMEGAIRKLLLETLTEQLIEQTGMGLERHKGENHPSLEIVRNSLLSSGVNFDSIPYGSDGSSPTGLYDIIVKEKSSGDASVADKGVKNLFRFRSMLLINAAEMNVSFKDSFVTIWPEAPYILDRIEPTQDFYSPYENECKSFSISHRGKYKTVVNKSDFSDSKVNEELVGNVTGFGDDSPRNLEAIEVYAIMDKESAIDVLDSLLVEYSDVKNDGVELSSAEGDMDGDIVEVEGSAPEGDGDASDEASGDDIPDDVLDEASGDDIPDDVLDEASGDDIPDDVLDEASGDDIPDDVLDEQLTGNGSKARPKKVDGVSGKIRKFPAEKIRKGGSPFKKAAKPSFLDLDGVLSDSSMIEKAILAVVSEKDGKKLSTTFSSEFFPVPEGLMVRVASIHKEYASYLDGGCSMEEMLNEMARLGGLHTHGDGEYPYLYEYSPFKLSGKSFYSIIIEGCVKPPVSSSIMFYSKYDKGLTKDFENFISRKG